MDKERKAIIKNSDMTEDMQQDAINVATKAIDSYNIEKDIACYIKKEFDRKHNPTWHCIVGRNFGSYVTHETKHFIYFYLGFIINKLFGKFTQKIIKALPLVSTLAICLIGFGLRRITSNTFAIFWLVIYYWNSSSCSWSSLAFLLN